MVATALSAPVDQELRDRDGEVFRIAFYMEDDTAVVRHLWLESGELSRGIMTPSSFQQSIQQALAEAGVPSVTPTPTPAPQPTVDRDVLEGPPHGAVAEIGGSYALGLYVHCGVRDAYFDGRRWMADPMISDGSGNPPLGWTPDDSAGVIELVSENLARFTSKTGRVIEFVPWPSVIPWRPCF